MTKLVTWVGKPRQVARSPCVVCGFGRKSQFMAAATAQVVWGLAVGWLWAWGNDENEDFTRENGGFTWIYTIFTLWKGCFWRTVISVVEIWSSLGIMGVSVGKNLGISPGKRSTHPSGLGSNSCYPLKDAAHFIQKSTNNYWRLTVRHFFCWGSNSCYN